MPKVEKKNLERENFIKKTLKSDSRDRVTETHLQRDQSGLFLAECFLPSPQKTQTTHTEYQTMLFPPHSAPQKSSPVVKLPSHPINIAVARKDQFAWKGEGTKTMTTLSGKNGNTT